MFRDYKVCKMLTNFIRRIKPDQLVLAGDVTDFYTISKFLKDPSRKENLQDELNDCYNVLFDFRELDENMEIDYLQGNHEKRLETYLRSNARALAELDALKIESLLDFEGLNIHYHRDGIWLGDLFVYHGSLVRKDSGATAKAERIKNGCSGMSGHTHRDGKSAIRTRGGHLCWWENACLCSLNPEYVAGVADWVHGWSLVTVTNRRPLVEQIAVINGKYTFRGETYRQ